MAVAKDDEHEDENLSTEPDTEKSETDSETTDEDGPDRVGGLFLTASEDCREEDEETEYLVDNLVPKDSMILRTYALEGRTWVGSARYARTASRIIAVFDS